MYRRIFLVLVMLVLALGFGQANADAPPQADGSGHQFQGSITPADRQAAADRAAATGQSQPAEGASTLAAATPGGTPDYFGTTPNYANSPLPQLDGSGHVIPGTGIRKFVDSLPGLGAANANDLGQYIPIAVPDTTTYPGSDYYEISLVQYTERLHKDLPPTTLRGYVQTNTTDTTVSRPSYLGPMIIAQKDRPVRVKFTNGLPTGAGGNLFIPVDTTVMGAGTGPNGGTETYKQNRATLHLHGGITPWISDGTPHQWTTPAGEVTSYPEGVSVSNVPDMPDPGPGSLTFFYTNQQSARLMFYHDHAYGITRLNVYAGEAAGYLVQDPVEQTLINGGTIPGTTVTVPAGTIPATQFPLIIQDKTFVDATTIAAQDPTWNWGTTPPTPHTGDLWFPHVYMPNQNPFDMMGVNAMGRWDYGPWFWPPYTGLVNGPVPNPLSGTTPLEGPVNPGTPNPSIVPEAFMDTPLVNGTAYPTLTVQPQAYRFRILNAANDRSLNLQLYQAKSNNPMWNPTTGALLDPNAGEVNMVPAAPNTGLPASWPTDGRDGGVPDPAAVGPSMIQIGTEGGFLPAPAVLPNTPVGYDYNRRSITVLNVLNKTLFLGPAERADVIVDFSAFAGKTIILYNDAPAPVPAFDPRYDYYTGDPDQTSTGGAPTTQPGYGPNTRTIMQIRVASGTPVTYNPTPLNTALPAAFAASQPPPVVPQAAYNAAYNASYPADAYVRIQDTSLTFTPAGSTTPMTIQLQPKAIQELFDTDYGRMNATLGVELPYTNNQTQTTIPYGYIDPPTETIQDSVTPMSPVAGDGTQIWKITHNGVDTHAIHFHLFNVQLINRVGWDGMIKPPDPNEVGWKDTVRMNPLEDAIVALRPVAPKTPFGLPDSIRPLDVTMPIGSSMGFTDIDPNGNPITVINQLFNFGWEYVWHCHLLGHEENDMMRPMVFNVARLLPAAPILSYTRVGAPVNLTWTDATPPIPANLGNPANEIGFRIQRATVGKGGQPGAYAQIGSALANATRYTDTTADTVSTYSYRVVAFNAAGSSTSTPVTVGPPTGLPAATTGLAATLQSGPQIGLTWTDNATNETGFVIERAVGAGAFSTLATVGPRTNTGGVSYADTTVTAGNTYQYRVKAVNGAGSSAYSNIASVSVPSPPAAPSSLTATLQSGPQVGLTWTDNATNETGFVVERAVGAGAFSTLATVGPRTNTGSVSYVDTTVTAGHTYAYRVKAVNAAGSSAYSNTASVSVAGLPAAPSGLTASAARAKGLTDTATLRWRDNANNETGFTIQRATNSTFTAGLNTSTVAANTTTTQQTGLARGTVYWYRIRAVNLVGASAWSNVVSVLEP